MMKCVFALVVLLHLCCSVKSDQNLNNEMITGLLELDKQARKGSITYPNMVQVPLQGMNKNASSCVKVFVRELSVFLHNVRVHEDSMHILKKLQANLQSMDAQHTAQTDKKCRMTRVRDVPPFSSYIMFLRKLNRSNGR